MFGLLIGLYLFFNLATGCSRSTSLAFVVQGDSQMNNGGHFAIVRIYQLSNDTRFLNADFDAFWQDDETLLADEIIPGTKQQIALYPEDPLPQKVDVEENTKFIAFAANLYNPDGDNWRKIYPVALLNKEGVTVWVRANQLMVDIP
jgi:type VI secretion system VasD/TssJ family lipoprotein